MPENSTYSKSALASMYKNGQGILSPARFDGKKRSFHFFGFAVGCFFSIFIAKFFNILIEDWTGYLIVGAGLITGGLGAVFMGSIFNANFVCDKSLQDPLFDYLRDLDRH